MKNFREMSIFGSPSQLSATIEAIEESLNDGWARDHAKERQGRERAFLDPDDLRYCFTCTNQGSRKAALLVLHSAESTVLKVANIVPKKLGQLSFDEYNAILEEFYQKFASQAAVSSGARIQMTGDTTKLEDWFSKSTADKLRSFSRSANKNSGSSHPSDLRKWQEFLVAAHREGSKLDGEKLHRWLREEEGWPDHFALELSSEYEFARDLLAFSDNPGGT